MATTQEVHAELLGEYSKTIDSSTLLAILSDYDLSNPSQLGAARQTLDILKEAAIAEEENGFDPSGANGSAIFVDDLGTGREGEESASAKSLGAWRSQTDNTSLDHEMSALDLEGPEFSESASPTTLNEDSDSTHTSHLDTLDEQGKGNALQVIFPALKPFDIQWTLKKCKGDISLAIDELMTQAFLEETGSRHRGIQAFVESDIPPRRHRKGKGKKKPALGTSDISTKEPPLPSKWGAGKQDIEFIMKATGMPMNQVSSIYHQSGGSIHMAIKAIVEAHTALKLESNDPMIQVNALNLQKEFPSIPISDLETLMQITDSSFTMARELAQALVSPKTTSIQPIQLEFRHAPIQDVDATETKHRVLGSGNPNRSVDAASAAALASSYSQARNAAFAKAQIAFRKGKSDPLMGGAAAYYSEVGRDLDAKAKSAESAAADALVASQSSRMQLDLHGVNVRDAVRISRERVTTWWHELGEGRIRGRGVSTGYRIVTGVGNHSEGRKGKLGPAVGKMLIREGWKVEVGSGVLIVSGVANRR